MDIPKSNASEFLPVGSPKLHDYNFEDASFFYPRDSLCLVYHEEVTDGFVAWKTKKIPTHEHKLAKKTLRDGRNGELTLEDRKRGLHSRTNVVDEDSTKMHVVDVVIHLT
jgi:hypothetical protein